MWFQDDGTRYWMNYPAPFSIEEEAGWIDALAADPRTLMFVGRDHDGVSRGLIGLMDVDWRARNAAVYIVVAPGMRGRGYGRAMLDALLLLAFDWYGLACLRAETNADNEAAVRLFRQARFAIVGTLPAWTYREGARVDQMVLSLSAQQYWRGQRR